MIFHLDIPEVYYSTVSVEADSLEEAIDKILRPDRWKFDDVSYNGDQEFECTLPPNGEFLWMDIDDNFKEIRTDGQ